MLKEIIIMGCVNCHFCIESDMSGGYYCGAVAKFSKRIEETELYSPVTPDWCPTKEGSVVVKYLDQ